MYAHGMRKVNFTLQEKVISIGSVIVIYVFSSWEVWRALKLELFSVAPPGKSYASSVLSKLPTCIIQPKLDDAS